jgi:hypothetical protein
MQNLTSQTPFQNFSIDFVRYLVYPFGRLESLALEPGKEDLAGHNFARSSGQIMSQYRRRAYQTTSSLCTKLYIKVLIPLSESSDTWNEDCLREPLLHRSNVPRHGFTVALNRKSWTFTSVYCALAQFSHLYLFCPRFYNGPFRRCRLLSRCRTFRLP